MPIAPLSPAEYRAAIYLDFEGEGRKHDGTVPLPHMAGVFRPNQKGKSGKHTCVFFSPLWKVVRNHFLKKAVIENFADCFEQLALEVNATGQHIVYWSIHEEMILKKYLPLSIFSMIEPKLHNLHPIARRYASRRRSFGRGESAKKKSLEDFFSALFKKRHPYPPFPLGAAEACRKIDKVCATQNRWKKFSAKQKSYADDLVQYNEGDCRSTWLIAKRIGNVYSNT
jgi:hypothetical protein